MEGATRPRRVRNAVEQSREPPNNDPLMPL
jgi:hypothetical protein